MNPTALSIRPFIGAKDFAVSTRFYQDLGFDEIRLGTGFSVFKTESLAFYLQDAYVKEWVENTQVFLEIPELELHFKKIEALKLPARYPGVRLEPIRNQPWGSEYFLHDPSGILWHFGNFK